MRTEKVLEIMEKATVYACYEDCYVGLYEVDDLRGLYNDFVFNHECEEIGFREWFFDMVKMGILCPVEYKLTYSTII